MRSAVDSRFVFDGPLKRRVRSVIVSGLARAGLTVEPLDDTATFVPDDTTKLPEMTQRFVGIPGMIPLRRCVDLYLLAYGGVPGDVIEIGSWQGRSTAFLAQACDDTDNGVVHAIDTFAGNPGHDHYGQGVETAFRANMDRVGLTHRVKVYPRPSVDAADEVKGTTDGARLLFIDGEHTYDAVNADLAAYADLVLPGGLIVFDDYAPGFDGDVRAVRDHLAAHPGRYARGFQQKNTLVLRRVG